MMRALLAGLLVLGTATLAAARDDARARLRQGVREFDGGAYSNAAAAFAEAATKAPAERLDPAVALYNEGTALLRAGQAADASQRYQEALRTRDLALQQKTAFNRGNALRDMARELEQAKQTQLAAQAMDEALAMYELAMTLDPADEAPKVNHELAAQERQRLQELLRKQQQQQPSEGQQDRNQQQQEQQEQSSEAGKQGDQEHPQNQQQGSGQEQRTGDTGQPKPEGQDEQQQGQAGQRAEEMTREEAALLLDAARQQEQAAREQLAQDRMRLNAAKLPPVEKDW